MGMVAYGSGASKEHTCFMKEDLEPIIGDENMVQEFPEVFEKVLECTAGMEEVRTEDILIRDVEAKNIMTKSKLPVGGYSVNPYVGCTHGCKYCYASFMKRFTGHTERVGNIS